MLKIVEGPPALALSKVRDIWYKKFGQMKCFPLPPHAGPGDAPKGASFALAEAPMYFFVSYHVGKMLKSVKVCLKCLVSNALGAAVYRPQSLAGQCAA